MFSKTDSPWKQDRCRVADISYNGYDMKTDHDFSYMLSVEDATARILRMFQVLETETKPLMDALGQVLAEDIVSEFNIPPLTNSAMDGYAVSHDSIRGSTEYSPTILEVVGHISAGQLPDNEVHHGTAIRIMTGAPVPTGADTVVPFEETDEEEKQKSGMSPSEIKQIKIMNDPPIGSNIRPAGQDIRINQVVLKNGTLLRPSELGVLASLGKDTVRVVRRPVVAIIATGDELMNPGDPLSPGKIYDSNTYSVAASVLRYGGIPKILGIAEDNLKSMHDKLDMGLQSDMLITSAGVSKGDFDIVKDVLASRGKIDFWSVRMRPAKPLAFGVFPGPSGNNVPMIGLPGNPVSAIVAFEELVRPAILKMQGRVDLLKPTIKAILEDDIVNYDGRRVYARAIVRYEDGQYYARLTGDQGSGILTSMALANGLAICSEDVERMKAGEIVEVQMLDWHESASISDGPSGL